MKITLSWLKDHLETEASLEEIVAVLTSVGLEVEAVEDKALALKPFTIARVIEAKPHPNADRLRVCVVDTGAGSPVQVVCGAPNARTGMMGVFSPPGSYIPGKKITLGKGVIRGVESNGMLVSEAELEISDDHDGIIDLAGRRRAARRALRSLCGARRRGHRDQPHAEPAGRRLHSRHRARPRRRRDRQAQGGAGRPGRGRFSLSRPGASRFCTRRCEAVPGVRASPRARREMRSLARLHAAPAQGDWPSPDQRARRHHQLHDLRSRTALARVRREEGRRRAHGAPRRERRDAPRARRQGLYVR